MRWNTKRRNKRKKVEHSVCDRAGVVMIRKQHVIMLFRRIPLLIIFNHSFYDAVKSIVRK